MDGYVRERRLAVEALEERALLSASPPLGHFFRFPSPPETSALTADLESVVTAFRALPQAEKALLVSRLYAVEADGGAAPDHERPSVETPERERGEYLRAALLELVAGCAADARVAAEGSTEARFTSTPQPAPRAAAEGSPVPAAPGREGEARGPGAALLRAEAAEAPRPPASAAAAADEPPPEAIAAGAGSPGAAAVAPPESTGDPSLAARAAALLEGSLPLDLPALKHEVDEFFARLADLGDGGDGWRGCARFGPWVIVMTAGVIEAARGWKRRSGRRASPGDEVIVGPAALLTEDE